MARGHSDAVLSLLRTLLEGDSMAGMTDGQLLERFASNQDTRAEGVRALLARHGPNVLGVSRHLLADGPLFSCEPTADSLLPGTGWQGRRRDHRCRQVAPIG
jgi:hypothetical protein